MAALSGREVAAFTSGLCISFEIVAPPPRFRERACALLKLLSQSGRQPWNLLASEPSYAKLVSVTRFPKSTQKEPTSAGRWLLQDAKARFSELVRRVRSEGPQHVTVHGRDAVVVVSAEEFRRLEGERTGQALIAAMQASPARDIDIEPKREAMPVREIEL